MVFRRLPRRSAVHSVGAMKHRIFVPFAPSRPPQIGRLDSAAAGAQGIVSAADPRAAEAGAEMLRAGGSSTDAAIATMLALTVVEPQSSGIGGGGFLVWGNPRGGVASYDGR